MSNNNEVIIKKIKGLLAIANDNKNDEESQTAFLMAQKLMIKNDISISEIDTNIEHKDIQDGQITSYKKLYWWEHELANIMSKNFKVKSYINSKYLQNSIHKKRAIMFLGYESDVVLAKEMYLLAYEALTFYANEFVNSYYENHAYLRERRITENIKSSYMRGFLSGLKQKFVEQLIQMREEFGLMVLVPKEVEETYGSIVTGGSLTYKLPPIEEIAAYEKGFYDGNKIDYTKKTIDNVI
ncbi:DUF2786 domain-containing protein [Cytobacillus horneckiae]|uniref:DUF2786 domain-containing protein n=1 Tax=Cytobacillus horneckiae TaxID=549687 RepID=A0A2N0ZAZ1_9BACI|nr:DUF2786 domain-containing protein [Cytobacillus horneckiae]MEC1158733.1 DUF2786 domain-containing protein [Cytobacillus horneckiae]NRG47438.1 DUF2786 domain-containing protein [Bacillus sp. CRN 9]PKG26659.1 DUF2786 domain-containing protein [Cytobacillus horneckiae]